MKKINKAKMKIMAISSLIWIGLWELAAVIIHSSILLSPPSRVLVRLWTMLGQGSTYMIVLRSLIHILSGLFLGLVLGIILAYLSHKSKGFKFFLIPVIKTLRAVPVASIIILLLVWFRSKLLAVPVSFIMVFPVAYTGMLEGLEDLDGYLDEMAIIFEISPSRKLRYIIFPQLMPYIRAIVGMTVGMAWKSGVAAEVIGMSGGSIGEMLQRAKTYLNTTDVLAWTLIIVIISVFVEKLLLAFLDKLAQIMEGEPADGH